MRNVDTNLLPKLYLVSQSVNNGYDTYDSAIVVAWNENDAKFIYPGLIDACWSEGIRDSWWKRYEPDWDTDNYSSPYYGASDWTHPDNVIVKEIGIANPDNIIGSVICASFNAG